MPQYVVVFGPEWERVITELRLIDETMARRLQLRMYKVADKYSDIAANKARRLPTPRNAGHTGLRERVASGVHPIVRGRAGVRIVTSMAEPDERIIPRGFDRKIGWRHPFFGDRSRWYRNPGYSWFMETMTDSREDFERELTDVLEESARRVADAGGIRP